MARKARDLSKPETKDVTIRGVTFTVAEFPEHEAELYDDFYQVHGGQQLDLDRQMLSIRADQIPKSKVAERLLRERDPVEKKLAAREEVYKETRDPKLFDEILELTGEIDVLEERMRSSTRDFDFEKAIRLGAEVQVQTGEILERLETIKFEFCHTLATDRKLTEMSLTEWQTGATKADKESSSILVNVGKGFTTRSVRSKAQAEPTPTPSAEKSSVSQAN